MAEDHSVENAGSEDQEKLEQQVNIEDVGPARKKVIIEIPASRIEGKLKENFDSLKTETALPGFRRGRAPLRLLEKRFGTDVRNEVKSQLIGESFAQVVEESELRVLGEPEIKDVDKLDLPESGPLSVEIEVEIVPEFELPDLKGLEVKKPRIDVTDDQVEAEISRYCEMNGQFKAVEGESQAGDYITADVTVLAGGEEAEQRKDLAIFVPGESRNFKGVVVGVMIEDLGHKLAGKKLSDVVKLSAKGPERHENEKLRNAELEIQINVSRIERLEPLTLEKLMEGSGFENEQAMREQVKSNLTMRAEADQKTAMQSQVTDALVEQVDVELPEDLSARQTESIVRRQTIEMMYRGMSKQDIEESLAELRTASREEAQRQLKLFFILDKVAKKYDIEVGEAEINGRIAQIAMQQNRRPERQRQEMARSGQLEQLYIQLREQKAIDKLMEEAKVTEVDASELEKDGEAKKKTTKKATKSTAKKAAEPKADEAEEKTDAAPKKKTTKKSSSKKNDDA